MDDINAMLGRLQPYVRKPEFEYMDDWLEQAKIVERTLELFCPAASELIKEWRARYADMGWPAFVAHYGWPGFVALIGHPPGGPMMQPNLDPVPQRVRQAIFARDGYTCRACGATEQLTIDHKYPRKFGFGNMETNLHTLCRPCNARKGVMEWPDYADMVGCPRD